MCGGTSTRAATSPGRSSGRRAPSPRCWTRRTTPTSSSTSPPARGSRSSARQRVARSVASPTSPSTTSPRSWSTGWARRSRGPATTPTQTSASGSTTTSRHPSSSSCRGATTPSTAPRPRTSTRTTSARTSGGLTMSREHAVAERPALACTARETRLPVREPAHDAPERGATTRDRLATALVGEERAAETTRERVATAVRTDPPATTPRPARGEAPRRAKGTTHRPPAVPTHPAPAHPKGRLTVDRPHGPTRTRAPPRVFTKLHVTDPADAWETHADAVAALALREDGRRHEHPAPPSGRPSGPDAVTTQAAQAVVEAALAGTGGVALPDGVRRRREPVLHADLSRVQVRQDAATVAAAKALGARAFTVGRTIHLGPGASTHDVGLMAHEATHVVQQGLAPARAPPVVMRSVSDYLPDVSVTDIIPDSVLDGVRTLVRSIPGYTALTYVVGQDLLTGEPVHVDVDALLDAVLTHGPFGPAVATVLRALSIAQDIYAAVTAAFAAHDLTLARFGRDIKAAWGELSITKGIDGNVAVVRRYVDAILSDLRALVSDLVDQVLALVRRAVVAVAEPFLQRPSVAPVWNLAKEVLHYDPLRGVEVQVPTVQIIADFLTLIGQTERLEQMRQRGTLQETADWLDTQMLTFLGIAGEVAALFAQAWEAIQPATLPDLLDTLPALADRAIGVVHRIADFATALILQVLELVKKALLGWLSEHAHRVPGFHLLTVIIGKNPFTGEVVPRTPANLIKGFITLLPNGEATYDELEKSGVVTEAAGRIEAAMVRLGISLDMVIATFRGVWDTLSLDDLLQPIAAFQRVVAQFGQPLARIIEFVGVVLQVVVELILRLMNFPTDLLQHVIANAMQAIEDIRRDPVGFLRNVMAALKLGFSNFFDHIGGYLLDGLVAWLFRGLGQLGIHLPTDFSLKSIIGLVLDVLGLSIEHLWDKLGEHIGKDKVALIRRAIDTIGGAWQFIADVQREGLPAIWRYVEGQLSNLWQMLLDAALSWITRIVVQQAVTKLLSFLDPTGIMAVINSAIAIFNAIQSAIEYLRDLLEVLDRYVSTLAAVAAGNVVPGAQMLEQGLAAIIPIAIGFLANQVGLGNIPEKIVEIVGGIRHLVDEALDWLIEQALRLGRAALDALGLGPKKPDKPEHPEEAATLQVDLPLAMDHTGHTLTFKVVGGQPQVVMASERADYLRMMTISALAEEERGAKRPGVIGPLKQIEPALKDLYEEWFAAYSKSDQDKRREINALLGHIAGILRGIGAEFKIESLEHLGHASKHVEGNRLVPPYDKDIRDWFYPSGYIKTTKTWRDNQLKPLLNPADATLFKDEFAGTWEPVDDVTIDHKPRVVEHWNGSDPSVAKAGNNSEPDDRKAFYNDTTPGKLQLVARKNNSADGALAKALGHLYAKTVGHDFGGPLDE